MVADWDTSGMHERRVDERVVPEPRRGWLGGRRRMAGVLTGVVSVAVIAGYIWAGRERAEPQAGAEPPLIQADDAPVRVPPESPGGLEIPHRDKLVLQRVPGAEEDPRRERLLPPPEEPLPPPREEPVASYEPPPESPPAPARETIVEERPAAAPRGETAGAGRATADPAPRPNVPAAPKPAAKAETPAAPAPQARAGDGPRPLVPQAQQPAPPAPPRGSGTAAGGTYVWPSDPARPSGSQSDVASASPGRTAPRTPPPSEARTAAGYAVPPAPGQSAAAGAYMVQLAAVGTVEQAQAAWARLRGTNGDLLAGLRPAYVRTDLGAKGVVYRLRAGPVQGETRARALCAQLAGRKVDCMIVRASG